MKERIYLITYCDNDYGKLVSHGVGEDTLKIHCLPPEPLNNFSPQFDAAGAPYIYMDDEPAE